MKEVGLMGLLYLIVVILAVGVSVRGPEPAPKATPVKVRHACCGWCGCDRDSCPQCSCDDCK